MFQIIKALCKIKRKESNSVSRFIALSESNNLTDDATKSHEKGFYLKIIHIYAN